MFGVFLLFSLPHLPYSLLCYGCVCLRTHHIQLLQLAICSYAYFHHWWLSSLYGTSNADLGPCCITFSIIHPVIIMLWKFGYKVFLWVFVLLMIAKTISWLQWSLYNLTLIGKQTLSWISDYWGRKCPFGTLNNMLYKLLNFLEDPAQLKHAITLSNPTNDS